MFLNLLVSLCSVVFSGDTLDVATVSASRNTAAAAVSPVQVMSGLRLESIGTIGLHEAVDQFAGVSVKDYGGVGGLKTVSVRNMGASHTSVVYDGIAISDAQNGQVDISRFNLDDISSVSMSIGLADTIFCSARHLTSAGILRLESYRPSSEKGTSGVNARMTIGSFGTYDPYISFHHGFGSGYAMKASLTGTFSNGNYPFELKNGKVTSVERRINSDVRSIGAEADLYADWQERGRLKAKVNMHDSERGLPGPVILYTQNAYERLWDKSLVSNVMYDLNIGDDMKFHADAGFTYDFSRYVNTDPVYASVQDNRYGQNEYSVAARLLYMPAPRWQVVLADDVFINTLDSNIPECPFPVRLTDAAALTAQYSCRQLKVTAALAGMYVTETLQTGDAPSDRFRLSPSIGLSWEFYRNLRLRADYKEGFRVPTFNDLYYSRVGNVDLKPEIARQYNIGLTFSEACLWGTFCLTSDFYYNRIKDKIVAIPTMFIWKMRNVGEVSMQGADITAAADWNISCWLAAHLSGNYSIQYALDVTDPDSKSYRHQIAYTPRHCGSGNASIETPWVNLSYRVTACGKRYMGNQNIPSNEMAAYADHCLGINRNFGLRNGHSMFISLDAMNLTGENYEVIHSYPMPGRSLRLTLRFKY